MTSICLNLHVHLPQVLRHYSVFDSGEHYFDAFRSREACRRLANRCVLPANRVLLGLVRRCEGRFRFSFSVSGIAIDLFERFAPEVLVSFQALTDTGCVEPLATTYDNSLAILYSNEAFSEQARMHRERAARLFGREPEVFFNNELLYGEELAAVAAELGHTAVLCDGLYDVLAGRSCNQVYRSRDGAVALLLRNEQLSRDVSERFVDRSWEEWPLTAPLYAERLARSAGADEVVTLVWDYATFGLGIAADAGIHDFLRYLPEKALAHGDLAFVTASEAVARHASNDIYSPGRVVSSTERHGNLSAWLGNPMQSHAAHRLFALEPEVRTAGDDAVHGDWLRLQACEYLEAMTTAGGVTGLATWSVEAASPYDAYINYMNVCDSLAERCGVALPV
jgi:alpha-amylase